MSERPSNRKAPSLLTLIALFGAPFAAYVAGYFVMGTHGYSGISLARIFPNRIVAISYVPAAWVEAKLSGGQITVGDQTSNVVNHMKP